MHPAATPLTAATERRARPRTPPSIAALLQRQDVETATWEAFLADVPMSWLDARPEVIPVGEAQDSDFGAFVEAAGAVA